MFKLPFILAPVIFCLLFACSSNPQPQSSTAAFGDLDQATWITDGRALPAHDSLFYLDHPAPLFRKEFNSDWVIEDAKLFITAAGYYTAWLNEQRIGKNVLDPAWTDYSKKIYYSEYDVTSLLKDGLNCLSVATGNGFYNPLPMRMWGRRNLRNDLPVGNPTFIAKLLISYKNGEKSEIISDGSWKYTYGPLVKNSVYLGVVYDARKEIKGWKNPGFDDSHWFPVRTRNGPGGQLKKAFFPPVQLVKEIIPKEITSPEPGIFLVDMGENFTGTYDIKMTGDVDDTITFRFGERLYDDGNVNPMTTVIGQIKRKGMGGPGAPDTAWQTDTYIFGNDLDASFQPEFTYHAYRYMEIEGLQKQPNLSDIRGLSLHSNVENKNHFSCSSELINSIQKATERTFLANMVSVQSDCPAREKFGYGGDINATSESFIYNFDMQAFYQKTIYDWVHAMNDTGFVDTAPFVGIQYCGLSWESAFLITQYYLYLYYQDTGIVKELYDLDNQWMEKVARLHPNGIVEQGLSDHESLEPVPVQLTGTCHYLQCARIMEKFAELMHDQVNQIKYARLSEKLKNLVKAKFWDQPITEKINRQTLFATLLYHDIIPPEQISLARDSLITAIQKGPAAHFTTGIFGTKYILETSAKEVSPRFVFDIVRSTAFPGWGFMIDQGATTIWETWKESDNTYSNCHPMFGSVSEWFFRWLGGIRPNPDHPGFQEFFLTPATPKGLEFVHCTYHSPFGKIVSNWKKISPKEVQYEFEVPAKTSANIRLKLNPSQKISIEMGEVPNFQAEKVAGLERGQFKLMEGTYLITISSI